MSTPASWFGDRAVSVALDRGDEREQVAALLESAFPHLVVRRGIASLLVESDEPDPELRAAVEAVLGARVRVPAAASASRTITIEVRYDGQDLAEVANRLRCSRDAVVAAHQQQTWRVAMMGFAPGFGYLVPEGELVLAWSDIERRSHPRQRVDAGSVAVAAGMSAVYPEAMPGGWPLVGRTSVRLFDPEAPTAPALLAPGDLVAFRTVGA